MGDMIGLKLCISIATFTCAHFLYFAEGFHKIIDTLQPYKRVIHSGQEFTERDDEEYNEKIAYLSESLLPQNNTN